MEIITMILTMAVIGVLSTAIVFYIINQTHDKFLEFEYEGNRFVSNVEPCELLDSCEYVTVTYNDGISKTFDHYEWEIHGKRIMKNCQNIKIKAKIEND